MNINRIKVVLADKNKTNKWLAEQLQKDPGTVSNGALTQCSLMWKRWWRLQDVWMWT